MREIIIDGEKYRLLKEDDHKRFNVTTHINGIQRTSEDFNNNADFFKWLKRSNSIVFNDRVDKFDMRIRWVEDLGNDKEDEE